MRERIGNHLLVTAVLALSVVTIASAAAAWATAGHRHHHRARKRRAPVFVISGELAGSLRLGAAGAQPLNLWITNRPRKRVIVTDIRVSVSSVRLPAGAPSSCAQSGPNAPNFALTNLPAPYRVTLPANATRSLAALGRQREPTVTWLDQPWAQNGCLGSTISFSYRAKGRYAKRLARARRHHR